MSRLTKGFLAVMALGLLAVWTVPALGDPVADKRAAQNKLLAYRAARADGIRKLGERIKGLFITSETKVEDFVTTSDTIKTAMTAFLTGVREKDKPKYMEDGTCEVTMEVTLKEVMVSLEQMCAKYYKGDKFKVADFEKMEVTNKLTVLTETGMGAPRPELAEDAMVPVAEGALESLTNMSAGAKEYWLARVQPQGRLMAVRAARVDGLRRLGERIAGVFITSTTTVKDFVAESDQINVEMAAFIRGARETGISYHADELIVEVEMEVTLREVFMSLKSWGAAHYKGDKVKITQFDELIVQAKDKILKETGMGVPPEKYLKGVEAGEQAVLNMAAAAPGWVGQAIRATGNAAVDAENANKAQAKLMAYRGAELDARRKLAEQLDGLMITSSTSVKDFVTANDEIRTSMLTFQQGGSVVEGSQKLMEDGTAEVTVEIDLKPLWNMITYYERKLSIKVK